MSLPVRFGYTPDPDDAFHYYALEHGDVTVPGFPRLEFVCEHIQRLNEMALGEELDVTAISSAFYPRIDQRYVILASGASVGRGYGPALARRPGEELTGLEGKRVAVPGLFTTGSFLLHYFHQGFEAVALPFDEVAAAVTSGSVDAGVLIHEELMHVAESGLVRQECLGRRWAEETGLPLPVGLVVARRALGEEPLTRVQGALRQSMEFALSHRPEALEFARRFGRGEESLFREDYVDKFANQDTVFMPEDVRLGLRELYHRAFGKGLIDHVPRQEVIS